MKKPKAMTEKAIKSLASTLCQEVLCETHSQINIMDILRMQRAAEKALVDYLGTPLTAQELTRQDLRQWLADNCKG